MKIVLAFLAAILLLATGIFLFDANEQGHTGWQIITHQGPAYILTGVLLLIVAAIAGVVAVARYNTTQQVGSLVVPALIALIFIAIVFGKGCTDVQNDGVTGPKGRPTTKANPPPVERITQPTMAQTTFE